ncbi:SLAC1 family transporter [Pseudomonas sp. Marseille-QA0892]
MNRAAAPRIPLIPASFFAMTLGLAETGNAWRFASDCWGLPREAGEMLEGLAILSFVVWLGLYVYKWCMAREAALAEWRDPVQSAFIALIPESVILIALAVQPYQHGLAVGLFWLGSVANLAYGALRMAATWQVQREPVQIVPPLLLTYSASVLVNALAAGAFGYVTYGWMLFGIGAVSWFVLDSVLTQQLMSGGLAARTRNFMGIYMAPCVVALVAYQMLSGAQAHLPVTLALSGYAVFVAAALFVSLGWLREQPFAAGYWAYTFGVATLAQGLILAVERHPHAGLETVAIIGFCAAIIVTGCVAVGTLRLWLRGGYFPAAPVSGGMPAK